MGAKENRNPKKDCGSATAAPNRRQNVETHETKYTSVGGTHVWMRRVMMATSATNIATEFMMDCRRGRGEREREKRGRREKAKVI